MKGKSMSRTEQVRPAQQSDHPAARLSAAGAWSRAAVALGWAGVVVEDMTLLGRRITVVAEIDHQIHADRLASGWGPIIDYAALCMAEDWPECSIVPAPAVRLTGFLAAARRWRQAMNRVGGFVGLGSTAILLGPSGLPTPVCTMTAHYYGVAVTRCTPQGAVEVVQEGRRGPVPGARPTAISREAEELVYQEILNRGLIAVPQRG